MKKKLIILVALYFLDLSFSVASNKKINKVKKKSIWKKLHYKIIFASLIGSAMLYGFYQNNKLNKIEKLQSKSESEKQFNNELLNTQPPKNRELNTIEEIKGEENTNIKENDSEDNQSTDVTEFNHITPENIDKNDADIINDDLQIKKLIFGGLLIGTTVLARKNIRKLNLNILQREKTLNQFKQTNFDKNKAHDPIHNRNDHNMKEFELFEKLVKNIKSIKKTDPNENRSDDATDNTIDHNKKEEELIKLINKEKLLLNTELSQEELLNEYFKEYGTRY